MTRSILCYKDVRATSSQLSWCAAFLAKLSVDLLLNRGAFATVRDTMGLVHVYRWTGENDYCQICDDERRKLCLGGVGDFGWVVSNDFMTCQTGPCQTFGNPQLASSQTFPIAEFEVYGLASPVLSFFGESSGQSPGQV